MRRLILSAIALISPLGVLAAPPSDASIEELLVLTKSEAMADATYALVEQHMREAHEAH